MKEKRRNSKKSLDVKASGLWILNLPYRLSHDFLKLAVISISNVLSDVIKLSSHSDEMVRLPTKSFETLQINNF